jgi:hypothetical protein
MRSTKLEVRQRVEAIFQLRLGGAEFHDIREYADAATDDDGKPRQPWGVSDSQLRRYIAEADELCKERFDARASHLLSRHLLQRRRLYAHAMEMSDIKTALAVLKDEAELERLYEAHDQPGPPGERDAGASPMGTADVVGVLATRLRQLEQSDLPTAEKSRLTATLAEALLRAIGVDVLDKRLEALQAVLLDRKDKGR